MTTKLEKKIAEFMSKHEGATVETIGVTGGEWGWFDRDGNDKLIAFTNERSNLAQIIRNHNRAEKVKDCFVLSGYTIVLGARRGGSRGRCAKQREFALIRL